MMGNRKYWSYGLIALTFCVIISWALHVAGHVSLQTAVRGSIIALLLVGSTYALRRFVLTHPRRRELSRRVLFIFCGTLCIGWPLWMVVGMALRRILGLSADDSAFLALPCYLLGAYVAGKLEKRTRVSTR